MLMTQDLATIFKEAEKAKNLKTPGETPMSQDLATLAKERGIKYFMISYTDLFGSQRAKLVPAVAIADMQKDGAGFAGFATWLDLTPAHPDLFGMPDPSSFIQLPWRKEVAWVAADCMMEDKYVDQAPRVVLKKLMADAQSVLGMRPNDLEITITETPRHCWGIRGRTGDELELAYKVDV